MAHSAFDIVNFDARDGYRLSGVRFRTRGKPRGHIVVAGATAVPQRFYARFAEHAAERGFSTLTFDYRGIAQSRRGSLKGFDASFIEWAKFDLSAAIDFTCDAMGADQAPLFLVGHSFGGQALGMIANHERVARSYLFGVGSGWHGWMTRAESRRVRFFWNVLSPPAVRLKGYLPSGWFGIGEDLPEGVYRQWRRWCGFPHHIFDDPAASDLWEFFPEVRHPITAVNAVDDAWAPPRSRDAFVNRGYVNAPIARVDLGLSVGPLGHMGYFRPQARRFWDRALEWLSAA